MTRGERATGHRRRRHEDPAPLRGVPIRRRHRHTTASIAAVYAGGTLVGVGAGVAVGRRLGDRTFRRAAALIGGAAGLLTALAWLRTVPSPDRSPLRFAVLDTETTGLDRHVDRVIEIAVVLTDGLGREQGERTWRVRPEDGRHGAEDIHHISEGDLADAPRFGDVALELDEMLAGRVTVAHNAEFDTGFLRREYRRAGRDEPPELRRPVCTVRLARALGIRPLRLAQVAEGLGVAPPAVAHRATDDARSTACILGPLLDRAGIANLDDLDRVRSAAPEPEPKAST